MRQVGVLKTATQKRLLLALTAVTALATAMLIRCVRLFALVLVIAGLAGTAFGGEVGDDDGSAVFSIDHFVPHVSTVPATSGERVKLFVRERFRPPHHKSVLFVHGNTIGSIPAFDLDREDFNWMTFLAEAGYDTFAMDTTGYDFSPMPKMDNPCNTSTAQQKAFLIPNPLPTTCGPSYPFVLTTAQSDWDEVGTVVDYIRELRGVEKVILIGWSFGGFRVAGYAARHPEKVDKLVLLAPTYTPTLRSDPPVPIPQPGVPMTVVDRNTFFATLWPPSSVGCPGQVPDGMQDLVWKTSTQNDTLGLSWGPSGLKRVRTFTIWGWNRAFANLFTTVPTLLIQGEFDQVVGDSRILYGDLGVAKKIFVRVQCASHMMSFEMQAMNIHSITSQWLTHAKLQHVSQGQFLLHVNGNLSALP